jgi:hypothetical protein
MKKSFVVHTSSILHGELVVHSGILHHPSLESDSLVLLLHVSVYIYSHTYMLRNDHIHYDKLFLAGAQ